MRIDSADFRSHDRPRDNPSHAELARVHVTLFKHPFRYWEIEAGNQKYRQAPNARSPVLFGFILSELQVLDKERDVYEKWTPAAVAHQTSAS